MNNAAALTAPRACDRVRFGYPNVAFDPCVLGSGSVASLAEALHAIIAAGTLRTIYGTCLDAATVKRLFRDDIGQLLGVVQ